MNISTKIERYWVAVNGSSVAAALSFPASIPTVSPTPQLLLGFPTQQEAQKAQSFLLNEPLSKCRKALYDWKLRAKQKGDIVVVEPENPEPPTTGATNWNWGSERT